MKLQVDEIEFNILLDETISPKNKIPIIFLHGFTGCVNDWEFIFKKLPPNFFPIAVDLIGHGDTASPNNSSLYSCGAILHQLNSIIEQLAIEKFVIVGYSLGGRAAISYSVKYPHKILAAIFESTTAGIENICDRKERVMHDLLLSEKIKKEGMEWFMNFWLNLPLFESINTKFDLDEIKNSRVKNNIIGLSNMLSGFSTGLMNNFWDELYYLEFPVLLISGELDEKFTLINRAMSERFNNVRLEFIKDAGHNAHLEKPELFTKLVVDFLNSLKGM